ncbi:hypothetical protein [Riemerella columbina]|uniref:hypothetical protein n=1 Tax=Riemerella columbina TaxID=103810 RepID=UPI00037674AA|nr:hypothetical protein [Riemerella columbina]
MNEKDKRFIMLWQNLRKSRVKFSLKQGIVIAFIFILFAATINYFLTKPENFKFFILKNTIIWLISSVILFIYYYYIGFKRYEQRYNQLINQDKDETTL